MRREEPHGVVIIDLLGLKAHAHLVSSIADICGKLVDRVYAASGAINWDVVPRQKRFQLKTEEGRGILFRNLRVLIPLLLGNKKVFVVGASLLWHLVIVLFGSPLRVSLLIHNEFMRIDQADGLGSRLLRVIFWVYCKRGFRIAVMSSSMRSNILSRGLYSENLLFVFLHPLPKTDSAIKFSAEGSVLLLGFLRAQKLKGVVGLFQQLSEVYGKKIRVFGRVSSDDTACDLAALGAELEIVQRAYTSEEERQFVSQGPISCVVFCPDRKYELLTPGTVMDSVRLGCYCISPTESAVAKELVGNLAITDIVKAEEDPAKYLANLRLERDDLNRKQFLSIMARTSVV